MELPRKNPLREMFFGVGLANFDRFVTGPMLLLMSRSLEVSLSEIAAISTAHFTAYGCSQPFWGICSDRYGRISVTRFALLGLAFTSALSAIAPSLYFLIEARLAAGLFCGALIPATITYIGDTVETERRQQVLGDMLAVMAVGSAIAMALAGVVADYSNWRFMFVAIAVLSMLTACRFCEMKDGVNLDRTPGVVAPILKVLKSPWAVLVMFFAFSEGALVLGLFALLPVAMQHAGIDAGASGILAALYGVSVLVMTRFVKYIARNPLHPMILGGSCLVLALSLPVIFSGVAPLAAAAILFGAVWAFYHSSLQTWMSAVVPSARATSVSFMTAALFLGGGLGTKLGSPYFEGHQTSVVFVFAAVSSTLLILLSVGARRYYVPSSIG